MPRKNKSPASPAPRPLTGPQRLNKILAAAGLGSRRECEQLIVDGRIEVDGQVVTDLATKVDPTTSDVSFDGTSLRSFRPVYYALYKPTGVLSTNRDPSGRTRAIDLLDIKERVFSVGRLDRSSEGLMLLTNDGELAQRLAHPKYGVQKTYLAVVAGEITKEDMMKLTRGVRLAEGYARVDGIKARKQRPGSTELEIVLSEGKNREIRRILARLGHKVVSLRRLAIGPLKLGTMPVGSWRPLTREEISALYATSSHRPKRKRPAVTGDMMDFEQLEKPETPGTKRDSSEKSDKPFKSSAAKGKGPAGRPADAKARPASKLKPQFEDDDDYDDDEFFAAGFPGMGDDDDFDDDDMPLIDLSEEGVSGTVIPFDEESEEQAAPPRRNTKRGAKRATGSASRGSSSRGAGSRGDRSPENRSGGRPARTGRGDGPGRAKRFTKSKPSFRQSSRSGGDAGPGDFLPEGPRGGASGGKRAGGGSGAKRGFKKGGPRAGSGGKRGGPKSGFKGKPGGPKKGPGRSRPKGK